MAKLKTCKGARICGCCGNGKAARAKEVGVAPKVTCKLSSEKKSYFETCGQFADLKNFKQAVVPL